MIEVEGISKSFGVVKAVDDVSFKVGKGEVVGFVGPNGAGKSTVMRILTCYLPPDAGEAKIAGLDVFDDSLEVRSKIGYLPENAPLYLDMEVDDFLDYVASIRGMKGQEKTEAIGRVIAQTGLADVLKKRIGELSKGYRQRVGLAQALIHDPEILILDEPTSGLDPIQIKNFRGMIRDLAKDKTIILSTHILSEVEAACESVIMINRGRIVARGNVESLKSKSARRNFHLMLARGPREKIESSLKTLDDVKGFTLLGEESGLLRYEVEARDGVALGEQLYRLAADGQFSLAELKRDEVDLEGVFAELVAGDEEFLAQRRKERELAEAEENEVGSDGDEDEEEETDED